MTAATLISAPPSIESTDFYYGLPFPPRLVARSSTYPWTQPTGLEAFRIPGISYVYKAREKRIALLSGGRSFEAQVASIEREIRGEKILIDHRQERLAEAERLATVNMMKEKGHQDEEIEDEVKQISPQSQAAREAKIALEDFLERQ